MDQFLSNHQYIKFWKKYLWLFFSGCFFIIWKFFLIHILWKDRLLPPEPDDAYVYIGYIQSITSCDAFLCNFPSISFHNYSGFTYLSYRLLLGGIAKASSLDPEIVFHMSFYAGILLLVPVLFFFLKRLTNNHHLIAFTLCLLALYSGNGAYHGFFWVTPSFFMVLLFFLLFGYYIKPPSWWPYPLIALIPLFVYSHPISVYTAVIFPAYFVLVSFFKKNFDFSLLKRCLIISIGLLVTYLPVSIYLNHFTTNNDPYGPSGSLERASIALQKASQGTKSEVLEKSSGLELPIFSLHDFKEYYLDWVSPHWSALLIFFLIIGFLIYCKRHELLALYISVLLFSISSIALNPFGFRSLVVLWPITFILYAFGTWDALSFFLGTKETIPL